MDKENNILKENDNEQVDVNEYSSFTRAMFEWVGSLVTAIIVVVLVLTFVFRIVNVSGQSMMNTLHNGDKIMITNLFYTPKNGDIVVITHGQQLQEPIVKRIIATERQTLSIDFNKGEVVVDGKVLEEDYIKDITTKSGDAQIPSVVPKGYVFVMGDNRNYSLDSRYKAVGLIKTSNILGKAQCIIFPFSRIGAL